MPARKEADRKVRIERFRRMISAAENKSENSKVGNVAGSSYKSDTEEDNGSTYNPTEKMNKAEKMRRISKKRRFL